MDAEKLEKTMHFVLEQQAAFIADIHRIDERLNLITSLIASLTSTVASLALSVQAHQQSLDRFDAKWTSFIERFDRYLRGQAGDGHEA
jgi:hypothetical protein